MRERLTYANVTATIALFLALGLGGAYAASKITSKDIAKSAVTSKAIKNKNVKGKDVKDGTIGPADLAALEAPLRPTLGNGGEGDCLWVDLSVAGLTGIEPVSVRRDAYGEVRFSGGATPQDGPGGDGACSGAGADASSDSQVLVLPPQFRPANSQFFGSPTQDAGIIVAGVNGFALGMTNLPPGAVFTAISGPVVLNEVNYLAADAPNSPEPARGRARVSRAELKQLLR